MKERLVVVCGLLFCLCVGTVWALDDACETPLTKEQLADHWVACEGVGPNKKSAVDRALKEGLSMVYGEVMTAEDRAKMQYSEKNIETPDVKIKEERSSESFASSVETKTAGFIREYNIVSVVSVDGGDFKAHVHARIINPRAGVDAVILVTPPEATIEMRTAIIKVGPKTSVSGKEICGVAEEALCGALADSKRYRVCTTKDIKSAAANNKLTSALVGAGMVPSSELLQAGQMLTCDYILSTRLENVAYSKKLGQDKTTKKFGPIYSMKVKLSLQLTNVRTGTSAAKETIVLELSNADIKSLLSDDEDADLLREALANIVDYLKGWIKASTK